MSNIRLMLRQSYRLNSIIKHILFLYAPPLATSFLGGTLGSSRPERPSGRKKQPNQLLIVTSLATYWCSYILLMPQVCYFVQLTSHRYVYILTNLSAFATQQQHSCLNYP